MPEYDETDLPDTISVDGRTFQREKFDRDSFNWTYTMDDAPDDYDWDDEDLDLAGGDAPVLGVELRYWDDEWKVRGFETAGPDAPVRPGFAEPIGSDYDSSFEELDDALDEVEALATRLVEERLPLPR